MIIKTHKFSTNKVWGFGLNIVHGKIDLTINIGYRMITLWIRR